VSHELPEEGRVALFDEEGSQLVVLNEVGGEIWRLLENPLRGDELVAELSRSIEQTPPEEEVRAEVLRFLNDLYQRGAVELVG